MGESAGEGEGLNLGLSIGGCFMRSVAMEEAEVEEKEREANGFKGTYCRSKGDAEECLEQRRKKELQALRRQNARRKYDQKRAKRAKTTGGDCEEQPGSGLKEEAQKRLMSMTNGAGYPNGGLPFVPLMQYVVQNGNKGQYIPVTVPYVVSCWPASSLPATRIRPALLTRDPVAVHGSGTVYQPVPCRSFGGDHRPRTQSSSGASSSSAVSDNKNGGGCSSECRSHSQSEQCRQPTASSLSQMRSMGKGEVRSKTPPLPNGSTSASASKEMVALDAGEGKGSVVISAPAASPNDTILPAYGEAEKADKKPDVGSSASGSGRQNAGVPSLPSMPFVATTGDGPNGKTVTGFLYRYTKSEVSIMCVCHGNSFSPAEFVKHAGGTDTANPLRHIIIVPSPVG